MGSQSHSQIPVTPRPAPITGHKLSSRTDPSSSQPSTAIGRSGIICFRCNKSSHIAANCSSHPNLLTAETNILDDFNMMYEDDPALLGVEGHSFMAPSYFALQAIEEDWKRRIIFMTTCFIGSLIAKIIIDPIASENIIAEKVYLSWD